MRVSRRSTPCRARWQKNLFKQTNARSETLRLATTLADATGRPSDLNPCWRRKPNDSQPACTVVGTISLQVWEVWRGLHRPIKTSPPTVSIILRTPRAWMHESIVVHRSPLLRPVEGIWNGALNDLRTNGSRHRSVRHQCISNSPCGDRQHDQGNDSSHVGWTVNQGPHHRPREDGRLLSDPCQPFRISQPTPESPAHLES